MHFLNEARCARRNLSDPEKTGVVFFDGNVLALIGLFFLVVIATNVGWQLLDKAIEKADYPLLLFFTFIECVLSHACFHVV